MNSAKLIFEIDETGHMTTEIVWTEKMSLEKKQAVCRGIASMVFAVNSGDAASEIQHAISAFSIVCDDEPMGRTALNLVEEAKKSFSPTGEEEPEDKKEIPMVPAIFVMSRTS